ncbi:MAG: protein involved in polysaccharide export with SLBB domain [Brevundimonas sp.]|jgi:protein involved in polysaccharide export with SLBB domain|uniref:polysaccharide biosynthesis/export family protein n=1 Tax=Brevundimonas sp. TaxID=1871086 RepID=UPI0039E6CB7A
MSMDRRHLLFALASAGALTACSGGAGLGRSAQTPDFPDIAFADWTDAEPEYLIYPGDELDIQTPTAPELNRAVRVGPDGRISMPLVGQVMAADRSLPELEASLATAYASQLRHPMVEVTLTQAGPLKVWVDGEVRTPGVYDMPGDIEAWQAVIMAGGFLPTARRSQVALIRRGPGNVRMMRVVDLSGPRTAAVALRRSDIIYVPRTTLAELAVFFTQVRESLPVSFSYSINDRAYTQF